MNQTPVGIKCKDCASIGKPQILILSKTATFFILINSSFKTNNATKYGLLSP